MSLSASLWQENADLAEAALRHPFVRGIADGTLERDAFAGYVAQDAFFLEAFARAYARALEQSGDGAFAELLAGVREELRLHAGYAGRWGIDLGAVAPREATRAYVDFLHERASRGAAGLTCAAMTPCMRLYAFLGRSLVGSERGDYAEWVTTYADPSFEGLAATLERLLDEHADDAPETHATYRRAMELELAFFDASLGR